MNGEAFKDLQLIGPSLIPSMPRAIPVDGEALRLELTSDTQLDLHYVDLSIPPSSSPSTSKSSFKSASKAPKPLLPPVRNLNFLNKNGFRAPDKQPTIANPTPEMNGVPPSNFKPSKFWPFWTKNANQISKEDYEKLLKSIAPKEVEFLAYKDVTIEISSNLDLNGTKIRAVLFVPWVIPMLTNRIIGSPAQNNGNANNSNDREDLGEEAKNNIKLCMGEFLVEDKCQNLMPKYLSFIKGVVDSEDAPKFFPPMESPDNNNKNNTNGNAKNYNKELVQSLRGVLVNTSLQILEEMNEKLFQQFYDRFSTNVKQGILEDLDNFERLLKLLRYHTSACGDEKVSLKDYLIRLKEGQDHIYYDIGESLDTIGNSQRVQRMVRKGFEVIYMIEDPLLEMSVVRKLSESRPLGGRAMIFLSDDVPPNRQLAAKPAPIKHVKVAVPIMENNDGSRPPSPDMKTSSDEDEAWKDHLIEYEELRRQPARQARPKSLKDRTFIVGRPPAAAAVPAQKPVTVSAPATVPPVAPRKGRPPKVDPNVVDYEGVIMPLKDFLRLPEPERDVVESVDSAFFDARRHSLCFKVRWKYYPPNHKDKYNNEWASNIHNFSGGVEAVEEYIKKIKIKSPTRSKTLKILSEWEKTKSEVAKELEEFETAKQLTHDSNPASTSPSQSQISDTNCMADMDSNVEMAEICPVFTEPSDIVIIDVESAKEATKNMPTQTSSTSTVAGPLLTTTVEEVDEDDLAIAARIRMKKFKTMEAKEFSKVNGISKNQGIRKVINVTETHTNKTNDNKYVSQSSQTSQDRISRATNTPKKRRPVYMDVGTCTDTRFFEDDRKTYRNKAVQTDKPPARTKIVDLRDKARPTTLARPPQQNVRIKQEPMDTGYEERELNDNPSYQIPMPIPPQQIKQEMVTRHQMVGQDYEYDEQEWYPQPPPRRRRPINVQQMRRRPITVQQMRGRPINAQQMQERPINVQQKQQRSQTDRQLYYTEQRQQPPQMPAFGVERGKHWKRKFWRKKRKQMSEPEFKIFRKQVERRSKKMKKAAEKKAKEVAAQAVRK